MRKRIQTLNVAKYRGQWVALNPSTYEVISYNRSLESAENEAKNKGIKHPLMYPVPKTDAIFIGGPIRVAE